MAAYGEGGAGFGDPSGYEGGEQSATWQWGEGQSVAEAPLMPFWEPHGEEQDHQATIFGFHVEPCADFQNGFCNLHKKGGKSSSICFCYHFPSQHRRAPADQATGRLLYWDIPCQIMSPGAGPQASCPSGDECIFAHSREEISYHPAKYKTRRCNGRGCRGESICCFAHSETEIREWAPERYSYWAMMSNMGNARGPDLASATDENGQWPSPDGEDWQRPAFANPQSPVTRHKQRFCASYPDVSQCRRGAACAFAHSRDEARTPLLTIQQEEQSQSALTEDFFMYHFKTLWCPIGVQHDWQTCVYAHNYQDARRKVDIGYGPKPCPYWAKKDPNAEYAQRCPLGLRCPFSHGAKEQLYHPQYFRTVICRDLRGGKCPRVRLCAFFHRRQERRKAPTDNTIYSMPLREEDLPASWVGDFLLPPFRDAAGQGSAPGSADDALQIDENGGAPGPGVPVSHDGQADDVSQYWCHPGTYWDPNAGCTEEMLEMATMMASTIGMCSDMVEPDMSQHDDSQHRGQLGMAGLSPVKLVPDGSKYDSDVWRLSLLPPTAKLANITDAEGTSPRTHRTDSGDVADDASTSAGGDFLAAAGFLLAHKANASRAGAVAAAGAIGTATGASTAGSSSASSSPWMVPSSQEPSWGNFGGAFDGYPGSMLSSFPVDGPVTVSSVPPNSSSLWDPKEPAMVV